MNSVLLRMVAACFLSCWHGIELNVKYGNRGVVLLHVYTGCLTFRRKFLVLMFLF